jgi:hypothetical protein
VQASPSSQGVPLGLIASVGQESDDPEQYSAGSQIELGSLEALQTVPLETLVSDGQVEEFPGQYSGTSQTPTDGLSRISN